MRLMRTHLLAALALLLLLPALAACKGRTASTPVAVLGYNHTDAYIAQFLVNGGSGGSADSHSEGGPRISKRSRRRPLRFRSTTSSETWPSISCAMARSRSSSPILCSVIPTIH